MRGAACLLLCGLLSGCAGNGQQDALNPQGPQAGVVADWFWLSFWLGVASFLVYGGLLLFGVVRAHRRQRRSATNDLPKRTGDRLVIWGGTGVPLALLIVLLISSTVMDRGIARLGRSQDVLLIHVTAHKFWWEVSYKDAANPSREFRTANELHLPAGRPVRILLDARDVIHSFWLPNLHGKVDL